MQRAPAVDYLNYSVQNKLVKASITEEQWNSLESDVRKYLFTISLSMDDAFRFNSFPPGYVVEGWTRGSIAIFQAIFKEWTQSGLDPRRHWGLFSLKIPGKTGNQCRIFFADYQRRGQEHILFTGPENAECLGMMEQQLFRTIVEVFLRRSQVQEKEVTEVFPGRGMLVGVTLCYAAPVIQLFARIDDVVELCRSQVAVADRSVCPLVADILDVREQLETPGRPILIEAIAQGLGLNTWEQQDVHELFTRFTSRLHDELDGTRRTDFVHLMGMQTLSRDKEDQGIAPIDSGLMMSINLTLPDQECTIQELIDGYFENLHIMSEPSLLTLHIIRQRLVVKHDLTAEARPEYKIMKIMTKVACRSSIRLPSSQTNYKLLQTIHHEGCSIESGHYFAIIYDDSRNVLIDGSTTMFISEHDTNVELRVSRSQLCMVIYHRDLHIRSWFPSRATRDTDIAHHNPAFQSHLFWSSAPPPISVRPDMQQLMPVSPPRSPFIRQSGGFPQPTERFGIPTIKMDGRHRFMSEREKMEIAHLTGSGVSQCLIARTIQRHKTTVGRFMKGAQATNAPRHSMLQDVKLQGIVLNESISRESKRLSCLRLSKLIARKYGIEMSKETVRQLRRLVGMRFLRPIPGCPLTQAHKDKRVAFAVDWIENRLNLLRRSPIIFTDESKVCLAEGTRRLWRIPGQCLEGEYVSIAQHPVQVMVWAAVSVGYKSRLFCFTETCNKERYIQMLEENGIFEELNDLFGDFQYVFQQDNAPPHVARGTTEWIRSRAHLLENWPAHSPDLNPIEVMWALMKQKIDVTAINTAEQLFQRASDAWEDISQEVVDNICSSFEARLRVVLHLKGHSLNGHWTLVHQVHIILKNSKPEETEKMLTDVFSRDFGRNVNRTVQNTACSSPLLIVSEMEQRTESSSDDDTEETEADLHIEQTSESDEEDQEQIECTDYGEQCREEPPWLSDGDPPNEDYADHDVEDTRNEPENDSIVNASGSSRLDVVMEYLKGAAARMKFIFGDGS